MGAGGAGPSRGRLAAVCSEGDGRWGGETAEVGMVARRRRRGGGGLGWHEEGQGGARGSRGGAPYWQGTTCGIRGGWAQVQHVGLDLCVLYTCVGAFRPESWAQNQGLVCSGFARSCCAGPSLAPVPVWMAGASLRLAVLTGPPEPHRPPRATAAAEPTWLACGNQPFDREGLGEARVASARPRCCCRDRQLCPWLKINTRDSWRSEEMLGSPHRQEVVCASLRSHRKLGGRAVWGTAGLVGGGRRHP